MDVDIRPPIGWSMSLGLICALTTALAVAGVARGIYLVAGAMALVALVAGRTLRVGVRIVGSELHVRGPLRTLVLPRTAIERFELRDRRGGVGAYGQRERLVVAVACNGGEHELGATSRTNSFVGLDSERRTDADDYCDQLNAWLGE